MLCGQGPAFANMTRRPSSENLLNLDSQKMVCDNPFYC